MLTAIHDHLRQQRPTLPRHARVYLGHIPNNIGLVAGQSAAIRVWYRDSTLQAGFYSSYHPRAASDPPGPDLFFRFDSLAGMVEVKAGPEDVRQAMAMNGDWEQDHENLAMLFLRKGDVGRAAVEFQKLSELSHRADAAVFASVCWSVDGNPARADSLLTDAQRRTQLPWSEMRGWMAKLKVAMPRAG